MITDAIGRAVAFILAPGQAHELPHAVALLDRLPDMPKWVVADRGYSSHAFREHIWSLGAKPAIPAKQNCSATIWMGGNLPDCRCTQNEAPVACPDWIYTHRNQVEMVCLQTTNSA